VKEPRVFIEHSLECIHRIQGYTTAGKTPFIESELVQDAVIRNLQIMCESLSRVPDEIKTAYPEIEWRGIAGLRNILVHDYLGVDVELVWQIVDARLPDLRIRLEAVLATL
jgi:uncharacterized protein with HEPN domain